MWCRFGNKRKREGKYKEPLKKKKYVIRERSPFGKTEKHEKGKRKH
jgi:hypothetical protein